MKHATVHMPPPHASDRDNTRRAQGNESTNESDVIAWNPTMARLMHASMRATKYAQMFCACAYSDPSSATMHIKTTKNKPVDAANDHMRATSSVNTCGCVVTLEYASTMSPCGVNNTRVHAHEAE
eukprot:3713114-Rhodomonas_salina.6